MSVYQVIYTEWDDTAEVGLGVYTTAEKADAYIRRQKMPWRYYIKVYTADDVDVNVEDVRGY